jgi:pimeloyl-ACP methyl ester carboxylesterase
MEYFESHDGLRIAFQEWGDDASSPPILLHHGFIADGTINWVGPGIAPALAGAKRHVVAIDARGHGKSDKPHDPARYGEANMARDVMRLADHLGARSYDLVGYSMGAVVSVLVAAQDARVRRLAVGGVGAAVVELGGVDRRSVPPGALVEALETDDPSTITNEGAKGFRAFADMVGADRLALAAQARSVHQQPIALDRIAAKTLVFAGADDVLAVRPELLAEAISGAELLRLTGDHMSAIGDPKLVPALLAFLG